MERVEWSLFPSRFDPTRSSMTLDLAGFKRRRKSLTHSALEDLVSVANPPTAPNESRPVISALYVDPRTLGAASARFVTDLLRDCTRRNVLQELVIYSPEPALSSVSWHDHSLPDVGDPNFLTTTVSNQVTDCRVDALLRVASSENLSVDVASLRSFQSNLLPSRPEALAAFLQTASGLQEVKLGHDRSCVSSLEGPSSQYLSDEVALTISDGLQPLSNLRFLRLSSFHGVGVGTLVSRLRLITSVELEVEFTPDIIAATRQLLVSSARLQSLTLTNKSAELDVDCGLLLARLPGSTSIQRLTLTRFVVRPCEASTMFPQLRVDVRGGRNSSLRELCFNACRLSPASLALPVTGLHRLSLRQCTTTKGPNLDMASEGPEAFIQRMVNHAELCSFRAIGSKSNPSEVLRCQDPQLAEQVLAVVRENPSLVELESIAIHESHSAIWDMLECYLKLNQAGRARDVEGELSPSLIPLLLARHASATESRFHVGILYHFVKRLAPLSVKSAIST